MINIDEYFEVDWEATGNRLKELLRERVSLEALAKWADRDVKTIRNWLRDPSAMGINRLLVLSKFLDMDVADIVVTKGKIKDIRACEDIVYAEEDIEIGDGNLDGSKSSKRIPMCNNAQQFTKKVIYNEWSRYLDKPDEDAPIQTLREFLIYLPLFDFKELSGFVYRTMGGVCDNMGYVYDQLQRLCARIEETDAKRYADRMMYFCLTAPNVKRITDEDLHVSLIKEKYEEYRKYEQSESYVVEQKAYNAACQRASDRFAFIFKLKLQLDEIMKDQIDYTAI